MIQINLNNVWSNVYYEEQDASPLKNILYKELKVDVPGAKYTYLFKSKQWDGQVQLWEDIVEGQAHLGVSVRTGLVPKLISLLNTSGISWRIGQDQRQIPETKLKATNVRLRDYQFEAVKAAFGNCIDGIGWFPRGVLNVATGGGKSEMAIAIYEMNPVSTFFLVHRKDLLVQIKERFEKYGHSPGVIGDSQFNPKEDLNVATMQTVRRVLNDEESDKFNSLKSLIGNCRQIFIDECHIVSSNLEKGNEFSWVLDQFDAPFRWGLSATPFMRVQYDNLLLEGAAGSVLYRVSSKELSDLGYLVRPTVIMKKVPGKLNVTIDWKTCKSNKAKTRYWHEVSERGIKFNEIRTNMILDAITGAEKPLLVLADTVEQAMFINRMFVARGNKEMRFLSGKDKSSVRKRAIQQMRDGLLDILLTTKIFDVGVDIPALKTIIRASGGKSQTDSIQKIGRALRPSPGKKTATVIDFLDSHHPMLKKHSDARIKTYTEQNFEIIFE